MKIPAPDVIRLIQAHLIEAGLHNSARSLAKETGVGLAGALQSNWIFHCAAGNWSMVLEQLSLIDQERARISNDLIASVHELAILEVAEAGDWSLATSMLRLTYHQLQESMTSIGTGEKERLTLSRARLLDQKLADLASVRSKDSAAPVPSDWYYEGSKQEMRDNIGRALHKAIPHQPSGRLTTLLQQAVQWQAYTGQLPHIKQWWGDDDDAAETQEPPKKRKRRKAFDLVLGQASVDPVLVGDTAFLDNAASDNEPLPNETYAIVKLGKNVTCESAVFLPDQSGLVTGSSDGLIEIHDAAHQYTQLRMDLPYQQKEELLGQDSSVTALAVSNDGSMLASGSKQGQVALWKLDTGKCLRTIDAHRDSISCIAFSPDASHILTAGRDGLVREFGLRTARMLKEFRGHEAFVNHASYQMRADQLLVVTAGGDGTVRVWDSKSLDVIRILRPVSIGRTLSEAGSSIAIDAQQTGADGAGSAAVHTVLHLHSPPLTMVVVPRGYRAFLVNYLGEVLRIYQDAGAVGDKVFVAATISPSNRSLYCVREDGVCCVFNVTNSELVGTIPNFGAETTRMPKGSSAAAEVSAMVCHPTKPMIAAYSNDGSQSRGQLVLWK